MQICRPWPDAKASGFFVGLIKLAKIAILAILAILANMANEEPMMRNYTLTELSNKSGEVVEAAFRGPVDITSRGKRKFVLMTAELYDQLAGRNTQKAYSVYSMSEQEREYFLGGLDAVANATDQNDD
jgi:prevent-host-death family protein